MLMWGIATYSIALNHLERKLISFSLPIFLTGSRRESQFDANMSLTTNTFIIFLLTKRLSLGKQEYLARA